MHGQVFVGNATRLFLFGMDLVGDVTLNINVYIGLLMMVYYNNAIRYFSRTHMSSCDRSRARYSLVVNHTMWWVVPYNSATGRRAKT